MPIYEAANRWVAKEHIDENTCQPCIDNDGKLYKNREDAYADYPDGKGYINCVGAEFGNDCRGTVVKRRGGRAVTPEQIEFINSLRAKTETFSAKMFTTVTGPTEGLKLVSVSNAANTSGNQQLYLYDYIGGYDGVSAIDVVNALDGVTGDGVIFEGSAIYTTLSNYAGGTLRTYVDGIAGSAASVVAMAGEEIIIEPAATMMVHAGSGGVWGTAKDMREQADVLDLLTESMAGIYAARTGGDTAEWLALLNSGDTWYKAQDAIDAKLATRLGGKVGTKTEDSVDVLAALGAAFTAPRLIKPAPDAALLPVSFSVEDLEKARTAMKGMFA